MNEPIPAWSIERPALKKRLGILQSTERFFPPGGGTAAGSGVGRKYISRAPGIRREERLAAERPKNEEEEKKPKGGR
jgi:hypothetical protein